MHLATWMILVAAILPMATVGLAKFGFAKGAPGYDNSRPRAYLASLDGVRARADWAHRNHFEAFPPFAAAVILAQMKGTPQPTIDALAVAFIVLRLAYTGAYLANLPGLRSGIWTAGFACVVALFVV